jgi:hypothetical protein
MRILILDKNLLTIHQYKSEHIRKNLEESGYPITSNNIYFGNCKRIDENNFSLLIFIAGYKNPLFVFDILTLY